jgi:hypothetical protein
MTNTWKNYSKQNDIPINDQYFLIYCETVDKMHEFARILHDSYGLTKIDANPGSIPRGPWIYANLNTKLMFHGNIGVDVLGGPVIGGHAILMEEFIDILEMFKKYDGLKMLQFDDIVQNLKPNARKLEESRDWFDECSRFVKENKDTLFVQIGPRPMYDMLDGKKLTISDADRLLRMNGYRGKTIIDDRSSIHMLMISMSSMKMISVLSHFDFFRDACYDKRTIDFEVFLQLHIRFRGRIRNQTVIGDRKVTFDIIGNY